MQQVWELLKINLSAFQRQQAIANAAIQEGERQLGDVEIDPNPFEKLAVAFSDVATAALELVQKSLAPIADFLFENRSVVLALSAAIVSSIAGRALPILASFGDQFLVSAQKAAISSRASKKELQTLSKALASEESKRAKLSQNESINEIKRFRETYSQRQKAHKSMIKNIINQEGELDIGIITEQRAAITKELNARAAGKGSALFKGITTEVLEAQRAMLTYIAGTKNVSVANQELANNTRSSWRIFSLTIRERINEANLNISLFKINTLGAFGAVSAAIREGGFSTGLQVFREEIKRANGPLINLTKTARLFSVTTTKLAGGLAFVTAAASRLISVFFSAFAIFTAVKFVFDQVRDALFPLPEAQEKFNKSLEDSETLVDGINELEVAFTKLNQRIEEDAVNAVSRYVKFLSGAVKTADNAFNSLNESVIIGVGDIDKLIARRENLQEVFEQELTFSDIGYTLGVALASALDAIGRKAIEVKDAVLGIFSIENIANFSASLAVSIAGAFDDAKQGLLQSIRGIFSGANQEASSLQAEFDKLNVDGFRDKILAAIGSVGNIDKTLEGLGSSTRLGENLIKELEDSGFDEAIVATIKKGLEGGSEGLSEALEEVFDDFEGGKGLEFIDVVNDFAKSGSFQQIASGAIQAEAGFSGLTDAVQNYDRAVNKINISNVVDVNSFNALQGLTQSLTDITEGLDEIEIDSATIVNSERLREVWNGLPERIREAVKSQSELNGETEVSLAALRQYNEEQLQTTIDALERLALEKEIIKTREEELKIQQNIIKAEDKLLSGTRASIALAVRGVQIEKEKLALQNQTLKIERQALEIQVSKLAINDASRLALVNEISIINQKISANERLSSLLNEELEAIDARNKVLRQELNLRQQTLNLIARSVEASTDLLGVSGLSGNLEALREELRLDQQINALLDSRLITEGNLKKLEERQKTVQEFDITVNDKQLLDVEKQLQSLKDKRIKIVASYDSGNTEERLEELENKLSTYNNDLVLKIQTKIQKNNELENLRQELTALLKLDDPSVNTSGIERQIRNLEEEITKLNKDEIIIRADILGTEEAIDKVENIVNDRSNISLGLNVQIENLERERKRLLSLKEEKISPSVDLQEQIDQATGQLETLDNQIKTLEGLKIIRVEEIRALTEANSAIQLIKQQLDIVNDVENQNLSITFARELQERKIGLQIAEQNQEILKSNRVIESQKQKYGELNRLLNDNEQLSEAEIKALEAQIAGVEKLFILEKSRLNGTKERILTLEQELEFQERLNRDIFTGEGIKGFVKTLGLGIQRAYKDIESGTETLVNGTINALDTAADSFADSVVNGTRGLTENIKAAFRGIAQEFLSNQLKQAIGVFFGGILGGAPEDPTERLIQNQNDLIDSLNDLKENIKVSATASMNVADAINATKTVTEAQRGPTPVQVDTTNPDPRTVQQAKQEAEVNLDTKKAEQVIERGMEDIVVNAKKGANPLPGLFEKIGEALDSFFKTLTRLVFPKLPVPDTKPLENGVEKVGKSLSDKSINISDIDFTLPEPPNWNIDPLLASTETLSTVFRNSAAEINTLEINSPETPEFEINSLNTATKDISSSVEMKANEIDNIKINTPKTPVWDISSLEEQFEESLTGYTNVLNREKDRISAERAEDQTLTPQLETIQVGVERIGEPQSVPPTVPDTSGGAGQGADALVPEPTSLLEAWKPVLDNFKNGFSSLLKNVFGDDFIDGLAPIFSNIANMLGTFLQSALGGLGGGSFAGLFATGGIIQGGIEKTIPASIPKFETGGVVSRPTVALVGEGSNKEAVVPLPNNREIPVQMMGGTGGDTINISQSYDFRNADSNSVGQLRAEAKAIEERTVQRIFSEINRGGVRAKQVGRRR